MNKFAPKNRVKKNRFTNNLYQNKFIKDDEYEYEYEEEEDIYKEIKIIEQPTVHEIELIKEKLIRRKQLLDEENNRLADESVIYNIKTDASELDLAYIKLINEKKNKNRGAHDKIATQMDEVNNMKGIDKQINIQAYSNKIKKNYESLHEHIKDIQTRIDSAKKFYNNLNTEIIKYKKLLQEEKDESKTVLLKEELNKLNDELTKYISKIANDVILIKSYIKKVNETKEEMTNIAEKQKENQQIINVNETYINQINNLLTNAESYDKELCTILDKCNLYVIQKNSIKKTDEEPNEEPNEEPTKKTVRLTPTVDISQLSEGLQHLWNLIEVESADKIEIKEKNNSIESTLNEYRYNESKNPDGIHYYSTFFSLLKISDYKILFDKVKAAFEIKKKNKEELKPKEAYDIFINLKDVDTLMKKKLYRELIDKLLKNASSKLKVAIVDAQKMTKKQIKDIIVEDLPGFKGFGNMYGCGKKKKFKARKLTKKDIDAIIKKFKSKKKGGNIFDDIGFYVNNAWDVITKGERIDAPPAVRDFLKQNQDTEIQSVAVYREPIQSGVQTLGNIITLGNLEKAKNKMNYDDLFHVFMIIEDTYGDHYIVEKNQVINMAQISQQDINRLSSIPHKEVSGLSDVTIGSFIDKGRKAMGEYNFSHYDVINNNCQVFLINLLNANGVLTEDIREFLYQDATKVVQELPSISKLLIDTATQTAALFDIVIHGRGFFDNRRLK